MAKWLGIERANQCWESVAILSCTVSCTFSCCMIMQQLNVIWPYWSARTMWIIICSFAKKISLCLSQTYN